MKKINKVLLGIISLSIIIPSNTFALEKDETVYTNLSYLGKSKESTVVNKLEYHNEEEFVDETELKKILNINGDEKYKKDGNSIIWTTDNKDIFYQGTTEKELPITVDIKYYLNNKKISPKKLKGKKGNIKVVMNFKNNEQHFYNGKTIYTPFAVTVGTIIDSTKNTNIEVSNGKVVETGTKSMLVALSSPGLTESLGLSEERDLDKVTFTYHTEKFSQENIYVVATPKLLDEEDLDIFNKIDNKLGKVDELQNGTNELEKGSTELANGTNTLKNSLGSEINNLRNSNNSSVGEIAKNSVTTELNNNLYTLVQNTVYNVVKAKVVGTKDAITNAQCSSFVGTLGYETCLSAITDDIVISKYTEPTYGEITTGLNQVLSYYVSQGGTMPSDENKNLAGLISYQVSGLLSTTDYAKYILNETTMSSYIVPTFNQVFNGVISSYGSIASKVAISTATEATNKTLTSLQTLYNAISQINDGANKISNGVNTLNSNGISTISTLASNYKNYANIVEELKRLSKDYNGFVSNNSKTTKFIYKIKSIK